MSTDPVEKNRSFAEKHGFPFPLLCDTTREISLAYGACRKPSARSAARISYLIGEDGRILRAYGRVNPSRHPGQVLADLTSLDD